MTKMTGTPHHRDLWRSHGGSQHGPCVETCTIPEAQFDAFCQSVEAPLLATIAARNVEIARLREALSDARSFVATTLARIGDGHRIAELCRDWDYLLNPALKEARHD